MESSEIMTCIVAFKGPKSITLAGDSAGVQGYDVTIRLDPKVFTVGPFSMGFTSSFRMGQILMDIVIPKQKKGVDDHKFMRTTFVDTIRQKFDKCGFGGKEASSDNDGGGDVGGVFIVIYKQQIYTIDSDFQVAMSSEPFESVGCGSSFAKGVMWSMQQAWTLNISPTAICTEALTAAAHFNCGVRAPFNIIEIPLKRKK